LRTLQGHTNGIYSVTFAPASPAIDAPPMVVSGSLDETLRLWNAATGECVKVLPMPRPYQGTNITGATGLTPAQKMALQTLGAIAL
jgi:WD40 repeat protein